MRLQSLACCLLLSAVVLTASAQENKHDGNWWRSNAPTENFTYIAGYLDGLAEKGAHCGFDLSMTIQLAPKACKQTLTDVKDRIGKNVGFFDNVTFGQMADGLDSFYADYRNRLILVPHALTMVMNGIHGASDADNQKAIEMWRKMDSN